VTTYLIWALLALLALGQPGTKGPVMAPAEVIGVHAAADIQGLQGKTYVALGDSISAGRYATAQDDTFPFVIADKLGMNLDLIARSGTKAVWGVNQIAGVNAAHPALVTIELGTNDVGFNTAPADFAAEYDTIVSDVAAGGARVVCIGSWLPSSGFDNIIASACDRHGGTYVSLAGFYSVNAFHASDGGTSYLGRADWFHPGDQGHAAIAAAVLSALGAGPAPDLVQASPSPSAPTDVIRIHPH
jgi:lysophospholipase L1-like esterase